MPATKSAKRAASGMTLGEHLSEARRRLLISLAAILLFGIVGFILYPQILHFLQRPYCQVTNGKNCTFLVIGPLDGLTLRVKIAFFAGFLFAAPVIFYQFWRFVSPGLRSREKKYIVPFLAAAVTFFVAGCALAYFIFPHALKFLQAIGGSQLHFDYTAQNYLSLITLMMVVFGLTFEFPVILTSLELAGVVTPAQLLRAWRWAIIVITIVAAVFTPSGDPFSMLLLAAPLTVFYFASIAVGKLAGK
jgi:sec-independent protein translocase protein TatC